VATAVVISGTTGYNVIANSGGTLSLTDFGAAANDILLIVAYIRDSAATINIPAGFTDISGHIRSGTIQVTIRVFARFFTAVTPAPFNVTFTGAGSGDVAIATYFKILNSSLDNLVVSLPTTSSLGGTPGTIVHSFLSLGLLKTTDKIIGIYGEADDRANAVLTGKVTTNDGASWSLAGGLVKTVYMNAATTTGTDGTLGVSYWAPSSNLTQTPGSTYYGFSVDDSVSGLTFSTGTIFFAIIAKSVASSYTYSATLAAESILDNKYWQQKRLRTLDLAWSAAPADKLRISGSNLICRINGIPYPMSFVTIRREWVSETLHLASVSLLLAKELFGLIGQTISIELTQRVSGIFPDYTTTLIAAATINSAQVSGDEKQTYVEAATTPTQVNRLSAWAPQKVLYRSSNLIRAEADWSVTPGDFVNGAPVYRVVSTATQGNVWFTEVSYGQS
jgi:hypothetical protein